MGHFHFEGGYVHYSPGAASSLDIADDLDIRVRVRRDNEFAVVGYLALKGSGLGAGAISLFTFQDLVFFSTTIGGVDKFNDGFVSLPTTLWPLGEWRWLRMTRNRTTGVYNWWLKADSDREPIEWGAVTHTAVGTAGQMDTNTDPLIVGAGFVGMIGSVSIRDGIGQRTAFRTGGTDVPPEGSTGYVAATGQPMVVVPTVHMYPSVTTADRLQQQPDLSHGCPTGIFDWMLSIEILLPEDPNSLWGIGQWGEAKWSYDTWQDITEYVRGLQWGRGSDEAYGRPRVGTGSITLASLDDEWSPWNPAPPVGSASLFAPGTIIRAGLRSALDVRAYGWIPLFTMLVDSWPVQYVGANGVDRFVDIQLVETCRDLAQIDDNSIGSLVGGGENPADRIARLLDAAGWQYGLKVEAQNILSTPSSYPLQSTDMADNRLAECYVTADSSDVHFRSDKTGAALLTGPEYIGTIGDADPAVYQMVDFSVRPSGVTSRIPSFGVDWDSWVAAGPMGERLYLPYRLDTLTTVNDDENVANDIRFARVGGTQQIVEQTASISRYGRRTLERSDLITTNDAFVEQLALYAGLRRGLTTMRVASVDIDTLDRGEENALVMATLDAAILVRCYAPDGLDIAGTPDRPFISGHVAGLEHHILLSFHGVQQWQTRFAIDTRNVYNLPGAELPATSL